MIEINLIQVEIQFYLNKIYLITDEVFDRNLVCKINFWNDKYTKHNTLKLDKNWSKTFSIQVPLAAEHEPGEEQGDRKHRSHAGGEREDRGGGEEDKGRHPQVGGDTTAPLKIYY